MFYTQIQSCILKQYKDGIKGKDKETENEFVFKLYFETEYYMTLSSLFIQALQIISICSLEDSE